jgi:drug/metabolite transporter (DMT)-like permease
MISVQIAIVVMLLSASVMSFSSIVLKMAAARMPAMESRGVAANVKTLLGNRTWLLGFFLSVSALGLNALALANADMSLVQPLSGFGLIVLVFAARIFLKEAITLREGLGVLFALAGVVTVGLASSSAPPMPGVSALDLLLQPLAEFWLVALVTFVAATWIGCRAAGYRGAGVIFAANTAIASTIGLTFSKVFFSSVSAGVELRVIHYVCLVVFLGFATMALVLQQFALQKGRAVVVVPVINMMQVAAPIPTGLLIFRETAAPLQWVGLAVLMLGVLVLSSGAGVRDQV